MVVSVVDMRVHDGYFFVAIGLIRTPGPAVLRIGKEIIVL